MTLKQFVLIATVVIAATTAIYASRSETKRIVYVAALDSNGAPIADLTAADLSVKEDGQACAIANLKEAFDPMDIAILDDDYGTGFFAPAVVQFIEALGDRAQYSIHAFAPARVQIMDYTNEVASIHAALEKIGKRGRIENTRDQLEVAISDVARQLKQRERRRKVILALTVSGEGRTPNATIVMDELAASGAMLNVVYYQNAKIGLVTGDGPRQSGGRIEMFGAPSAVPAAITRISSVLLHQYALTYTLPDGVKASGRIKISTSREGIKLLAPTRIPEK